MVPNIAARVLANAGALWAAVRYIPGFHIAPIEFFPMSFLPIDPVIQTYAAAGITLAAVNAGLSPVLRVIAAALPFLTTVMLLVALNLTLIYAGTVFLPVFIPIGLKPLILSSLLLGIMNALL